MKIIKLNAINSTNTYLINLSKDGSLQDETVVVATRQLEGRGQLGAKWQATARQSLTFSVFKKLNSLPVHLLPSIAFAVSIAVNSSLKKLLISTVEVKWPNDIMSRSKKIAGILIENQIKSNSITSSVIGIGINVNETQFVNLPQATSMRLETGNSYNLDEVLIIVAKAVLDELNKIETTSFAKLKTIYEASLFRKEVISVFETPNGNRFNGKIKGVSKAGELLLEDEDEIIKHYKLKEIKLLF